MTTHPVPVERPHLADARAKAATTYDRRRARDMAEALATIPPARWDDATRAIIITLATLAVPSRIDDVLDELIPLREDEQEQEGTLDIRVAMAGELRRMGLMDDEPDPVHDNGDYRA